MDLTDEQWEVVRSLIPLPHRRADGRGRPRVEDRKILNRIFGSCVLELPGMTCLINIHHIRVPIVVFSTGGVLGCLRRFLKHLPEI